MAQGDKTKQNDGHKSCKGLALGLVKCLNESSCIKEEKRSYKECVFGKNLSAFSSECEEFRDKYLQCKHDQVSQAVKDRFLQNPDAFYPL